MSGLGAPVRVYISQHDSEQTRIDVDQVTAFFSKFPELAPFAAALSPPTTWSEEKVQQRHPLTYQR